MFVLEVMLKRKHNGHVPLTEIKEGVWTICRICTNAEFTWGYVPCGGPPEDLDRRLALENTLQWMADRE